LAQPLGTWKCQRKKREKYLIWPWISDFTMVQLLKMEIFSFNQQNLGKIVLINSKFHYFLFCWKNSPIFHFTKLKGKNWENLAYKYDYSSRTCMQCMMVCSKNGILEEKHMWWPRHNLHDLVLKKSYVKVCVKKICTLLLTAPIINFNCRPLCNNWLQPTHVENHLSPII
jgi:hypothetical protein